MSFIALACICKSKYRGLRGKIGGIAMTSRILRALGGVAIALSMTLPSIGTAQNSVAYLPQGPNWTNATRAAFYTQDQGAAMIPYRWLVAIKTPDGKPFLFDQLQRYGYLRNAFATGTSNLPIGFTLAGPTGSQMAGMTCAACHTRDIVANNVTYRVDGGPAIIDFQAFLVDMVGGVGQALASDAAFTEFGTAVLGPNATPAQRANLKIAAETWYLRENAMITGALPHADQWGLGRLDAVSMIFNRLTGLDLGAAPTYLIASNIRAADAPVRYPFLWNAPTQDKTQWPGFADNGNDLLGLARNLGEVYGVFGIYHPVKSDTLISNVNFLKGNSANFSGLGALENLVKKIGAPRWPFAIDSQLAAQGKAIYARPTASGGCVDCHGQKPGVTRLILQRTWATPIQDVGTDSRQYSVLKRNAESGVLEGGKFWLVGQPIPNTTTAFSLLGFSVIGSIAQQKLTLLSPSATAQAKSQAKRLAPPNELAGAFREDAVNPPTNIYNYESRVLYGIWAAAPYLHNGSVPTLADLLKPAAQRPVTFAVGANYDPARVGLAAQQPGAYSRTTTGCEARDSGNSRCGHEFGTTLSDAEKAALLEFLKVL